MVSPDLFNLYSEKIIREISQLKGVSLPGRNINMIKYADGTVLLAELEYQLQGLVTALTEASKERG